ncbi:Hypothetical predicted protein, partial [Paramuricea clavata]
MAENAVSQALKKIEIFVEGFLSSPNGVSYGLVEYLVADEGKLKWLGSLEDLKLFIESSLRMDGRWSSPGGNAKKFTLKSVEPDQQFGFVWYCRKQNTIVFQGVPESVEAAKSKLISIANKHVNKETTSIAVSEQLFDQVDLQVRGVDCDGPDRREQDLNVIIVVNEESQTEYTSSLINGSSTQSACACTCSQGEIIAEIEGIKLDLAIFKSQSCFGTDNQYDSLQSNIKSLQSTQKSLKNIIKTQDETINSLQQEIFVFKSKLLSLETLLFNVNPQLNASLDLDSQIQCTAKVNPQGSNNDVGKSNCEILLPTHSNNNQSTNENLPSENCMTICSSPKSYFNINANDPSPLVSDVVLVLPASNADLMPKSSLGVEVNVPVPNVSDANLPPTNEMQVPKNETPCPKSRPTKYSDFDAPTRNKITESRVCSNTSPPLSPVFSVSTAVPSTKINVSTTTNDDPSSSPSVFTSPTRQNERAVSPKLLSAPTRHNEQAVSPKLPSEAMVTPTLANAPTISTSYVARDNNFPLPTLLVANVRSIINKIDELQLVAQINQVEVICITESWLNTSVVDSMISLSNFIQFRNDRTYSCGGGVSIYIKEEIYCRRLEHFEDSAIESLWLLLRPKRLPRSISALLLAVIYHTTSSGANENFELYNHIQRNVESFLSLHPDGLVFVTGDFNPVSTLFDEKRLKRLSGLTQIINVPTRHNAILDWCLTNAKKV